MPKHKGALGLKNLRLMNEAFLVKHLHKFYNKEDVPWVQLIWHTHFALGQIPHSSLDLSYNVPGTVGTRNGNRQLRKHGTKGGILLIFVQLITGTCSQ
jgi:hypothetical protein